MLTIKNLYATIDGNEILRGINLAVQRGEVHALMGPNGSGKSTLAKVIAGHPDYQVTSGDIRYSANFRDISLLELAPYERAQKGIFLAFQYPVALPGVTNRTFLRSSFNAICQAQGVEALDEEAFDVFLQQKLDQVGMSATFMDRAVNDGFSGGEKKRNEALQMALLNPHLSILDETDSGLDIDSLRSIAKSINKMRSKSNAFIVITHYQRLLDYIKPDFVHVIWNGRIVKSGGPELALKLEEKGYDWIKKEAQI